MSHCESIEFGGRVISLETGRLARQANGAVWVEYGDSRVLVTACAEESRREGIDFLPLTVDYQEKIFSVGRIPGGFIKREARPQQREVLTSRLIDRPIRPLFPDNYNMETQIIATVFCADMENDTEVMAMIGASAALHVSDMPFQGPIAGVRVGLIDGEFVCNPAYADLARSRMDILVAASSEAIVMVEGQTEEVSEDEMVQGLMKAFEWAQPVIELQNKLREAVGKPIMELPEIEVDEDLKKKIEEMALPGLREAYSIADKQARYAALDKVKKQVKEALAELPEKDLPKVPAYLKEIKYRYVRDLYTREKARIDRRALDEVRPITIETGLLPRVHGSALFSRGETQSLVSVTLGTLSDSQRVDDMLGDRKKRFFLHYNFPPYSVGEVRRMGAPGRREVGHGNLAERALERQIPIDTDEFPYTARIVSEILESNGSSSMASVCGGCLAMMDAGVPITKPVAGIAMGLIKEGDTVLILSDILGDEDHLGDMDFKVCGTRDGITAIQMDLKIGGIDRDILSRALAQAREGRMYILDKMLEHIPEPRPEYSAYAPRIITIHINPDRIRDVIGQGGKTIREIVEQTGCKIDVEDDGSILVASPNLEDCNRAIEIIKGLTEEPEVGKVYNGRVIRIVDFGAFIEIIPGIEGLLHISEVDHKRIDKVEDYLHEGDMIDVKLIDFERNGKLRLSRRALLPKPEGGSERSDRPRHPPGSSRRDQGTRGNRDRRDDSGRGGGGRNRR